MDSPDFRDTDLCVLEGRGKRRPYRPPATDDLGYRPVPDLTEVTGICIVLALLASWVLREQTTLLGRARPNRLYTAVLLGELGARPVVTLLAQSYWLSPRLGLVLLAAQAGALGFELVLLRWLGRLGWPRALKLAAVLAVLSTLTLLALFYRTRR